VRLLLLFLLLLLLRCHSLRTGDQSPLPAATVPSGLQNSQSTLLLPRTRPLAPTADGAHSGGQRSLRTQPRCQRLEVPVAEHGRAQPLGALCGQHRPDRVSARRRRAPVIGGGHSVGPTPERATAAQRAESRGGARAAAAVVGCAPESPPIGHRA
jgi:hypothetical protein